MGESVNSRARWAGPGVLLFGLSITLFGVIGYVASRPPPEEKTVTVIQPGQTRTIVEYRDREGAVPRSSPGLLEALDELDPRERASAYESVFEQVTSAPRSTFSIDVDTASYSNTRRALRDGGLPPIDAVRVEEFINYFSYDYPEPRGNAPLSLTTEVAPCPWAPGHQLALIGLKGRAIPDDAVPPRSLVFLLDVSGSMLEQLALLKRGLSMLTRTLRPQDTIAIVVYAGASGLVLPVTSGAARAEILDALERLEAGGSTNGGAGIELAYAVAQESFKPGGINRVILATDGDFNVGLTGRDALERLIAAKRETGVFLTVLGFGDDGGDDATMELLADKGNGNYAFIDSVREAEKVLVREAGATLTTVARDVKIQVEFNPTRVSEYRLIGYENRLLAARDFNDERKDAGELGAGHTVTALYELVPPGADARCDAPVLDPLRYQGATEAARAGELLTVKARYKTASGSTSQRIVKRVEEVNTTIEQSSENLRFAAGVASFAMLLRGSKFGAGADLFRARELVAGALGRDEDGDRRELLRLFSEVAQIGLGSRSSRI